MKIFVGNIDMNIVKKNVFLVEVFMKVICFYFKLYNVDIVLRVEFYGYLVGKLNDFICIVG